MTSIAAGSEGQDQAVRDAITKLFNDTRKRLVETGTRNRLVHVNRANTRGNVINIVNERSDDIYDLLSGGTVMRFRALGRDKDEDRGDVVLAEAEEQAFDEERYTDAQLETRLGPDALQKKLLKIAREAQTAEEESGVNMLYLALGFLTWFEDKSSQMPREAPLVLLPVELKRNHRTSTYDICARDEDILTNLPLQQRLKEDFGIDLPELEVSEEWKPADYFAKIAGVITSQTTWKIEVDAIQLGFFSFSKLLMYRDLAVEAWPNGAIAAHGLTKGLLYEGFESEEALFGPNDRLDEVLPPEKLFHVVDADASQAKVIEEVRTGRNLVVQGPPGTGKSQTIANIIAAAVREGKRVLFLAEKMAALSVVHERLVKVGLKDICLELHSRGANKKTVLGELARTLSSALAIPNMPGAPDALKASRDHLNGVAEALHRPLGMTGETPFSLLGRQSLFLGDGHPAPSLDMASLGSISREVEATLLATIKAYGELMGSGEYSGAHPYEGVRNLDLQPVELSRLSAVLLSANSALTTLASIILDAIEALGLPLPATFSSARSFSGILKLLEGLPKGSGEVALAVLNSPDLPRLRGDLQVGAVWQEAYGKASALFVEAAFTGSHSHLRAPLVAGANSFFARWGGGYRNASRELAGLLRHALPKKAADRVELLDTLTSVSTLRAQWENDSDYCSRALSNAWRGNKTEFATLLPVADWCAGLANAEPRPPWPNAVELASHPERLATLQKKLGDAEPVARRALDAIEKLLDSDPAILVYLTSTARTSRF